MSDYLPDELVFDILSRLPSEALLRCRSVCRSWRSLISSNNFKLTHLKTSNLSKPRNFIRSFDLLSDKEVYSVHFNDEALTMVPDTLVESPFRYCNYCTKNYLRVMGSVNGVLCFFHGNCESDEDKIVLWNPSIRRHLIISAAMFHLSHVQYLCLIYGFGYDKTSDDFKVVRLAYKCRSAPQVEVHSVKNGVSRVVRPHHDMPSYPMFLDSWSQLFFNGCVHWVACDYAIGGSDASIVIFDVSTELFGKIELPRYLVKKHASFLKLSVVGGCLTVTYSRRPSFAFPGPSGYIISTMIEYKNTASWTLMYDAQFSYDLGRVLHLRDDRGILMGSVYGDLKFYEHNVGYFFDLYSRFVVEDAIYIGQYQESLALLDEANAKSDIEPNKSSSSSPEAASLPRGNREAASSEIPGMSVGV